MNVTHHCTHCFKDSFLMPSGLPCCVNKECKKYNQFAHGWSEATKAASKTKFKREVRYYVVKHKDITPRQHRLLIDLLSQAGIPTVDCVVIESDWECYEEAWKLVEAEWLKKQDQV